MRSHMHETSDSNIELIVPVINKGSRTYHFSFPTSARAGAVLLSMLKAGEDMQQRKFDLSTPLFDLSRFRYPTVNLAQPEPADADEALNRYLDQHQEVFKVLQMVNNRLGELSRRWPSQVMVLFFLLITLTGLAFLLHENTTVSAPEEIRAVASTLRPWFPWLVGVPIALSVATLLLWVRLSLPLRSFLTETDRVLLRTYLMDRNITTEMFIQQHSKSPQMG